MNLMNKISLNVLVVNDSHVMSIKETKIGYEEHFEDMFFMPHVENKTYVINMVTKKAEPCIVISKNNSNNDEIEKLKRHRMNLFAKYNANEKAVYMSRFEPKIY